MGNSIGGRRKSGLEELFTRPQGLHENLDQRKLRKLILEAKLAPCYPDGGDLEQCPICFQYYPSLNRSKCCSKGICTECFLQLKPTQTDRPILCPFCKTPNYAVEYLGVKTKKKRSIEQFLGDTSLFFVPAKKTEMDDMYIELDVLECAVDGSKKPCNLKFSFLQFITKQFSDELKIGHGGCGLVYKGILPNGFIAVKRLLNNYTIDDKMFHQEVTSLMMVAHKNTVRLLGYCSHTEEKAMEMSGKIIMAEIRERLLCFEYVTNGSLENHITDELRGHEWYTRYQIIKGICEGLHHLHKEKHIIHLDLKPANILLDDDMVPKISDFGLSRLDEKSHTMSAEQLLTLGYCAPEYLQRGKRSAKSDIYSLGVIITELVTGSRGNPCITKVLRRWKHRWNKSAIDTQLWFKQVSTCLDLALRCKHTDPTDRPNIWDIITDLNKMENASGHINNDTECLKLENMLDVEPLEMHFPFELYKHIPGSIELTNDTDDYFAFRMSSISVRPYFIHPVKGIVPPQSKCSVTIMLQPQERVPPQFPCKDEFSVQSTRVGVSLTALDITEDMFHEEFGKVVDEVTLKVVLDSPSPPGNH